MTFDSVGGDDINLDATTSEPDTTPVVENILISEVASNNGQGVGINLNNNKRAATISQFVHDGGTTGAGAMLFTEAEGSVNVDEICAIMSVRLPRVEPLYEPPPPRSAASAAAQ